MNFKRTLSFLFLPILALVIASCGTAPLPTSDNPSIQLTGYYDLRDRESFVQVTNVLNNNITIHVQLFNVNLDCTENNFYDTLTGSDTHVYNIRDIQTNNGEPSGVNLLDDAYGFVVITIVEGVGGEAVNFSLNDLIIGNFRILDNSGYEYRTNMQGFNTNEPFEFGIGSALTFNFNQFGGANLSDIVGIAFENGGPGNVEVVATNFEVVNVIFDVDITDNRENQFSCRDIMFACINEDNPKYNDLLSAVSENILFNDVAVNVAGLEYGINDAFPNSQGAPVLCPQNNITEGTVRLTVEDAFGELPGNLNDGILGFLDGDEFFAGYVGLNNGAGRGSMDAMWYPGLGELFALISSGEALLQCDIENDFEGCCRNFTGDELDGEECACLIQTGGDPSCTEEP